ncbi:MAG: inositol monophosphatase [Planctomycetota bacterium]
MRKDVVTGSARDFVAELSELQRRIRDAVRGQMAAQAREQWSRSARDDAGDTTFGIDVTAEDVLLPFCEAWGKKAPFVLIAEGLPPEGLTFGASAGSGTAFRLIVDPIDGTRGLMYDKRSAWCLAAVAPDRGPATCLSEIECAVMTELPTTRAGFADRLWAVRGRGANGEREGLLDGSTRPLSLVPSQRPDLLHGFATVVNFFQGGKELASLIDEEIVRRERGGWNPGKAEVYTDQYICSGGQLAELALGRDRFVLDVRPLLHQALGIDSSLCSRPYDLCTALIATEAGCVVTAPDGEPLRAPLDVVTNVAFAGYANAQLAARLQPMVTETLRRHGVL